jgi:hypothetical protein
VISIVAVHGLGTDSRTTWVAHTDVDCDGENTRTYVNWLSDKRMLPKVTPNARIWTFNYDSKWYYEAPAQRLLPLAEVFLTVLHDNLTKARS